MRGRHVVPARFAVCSARLAQLLIGAPRAGTQQPRCAGLEDRALGAAAAIAVGQRHLRRRAASCAGDVARACNGCGVVLER